MFAPKEIRVQNRFTFYPITYLTFFSLAEGLNLGGSITRIPENVLIAVSAGAVFMGANSYIGNTPNFMVKSICEELGIKIPSFFGYMIYSSLVLIGISARGIVKR